ncbi:hypothetical protein HYH03_007321 [Edaphochlamys debaryana]|uniref:Uncharacterized protein n=1 Tax=Edaphochlamys debaryana TaxID=47281 RepID=A0A835YBL9_9CHLO|nr:hypothetical protein HYH03_007321 [Edaphochlamys debaryana]|eukprot:KAG2494554.1 hypothetical protein HYH03_007321 [Edaphochlamys debaryana]
MTAYMALHKYGSPHQEPLRDPMLYDTVLTKEGQRLVAALAPAVAALQPAPELVLTSPLTRCLQTAVAACQGLRHGVRIEAEPLLRERLTLSSEVGRPPEELARDFPEVRFPPDMEHVWWYTEGLEPHKVAREPQPVYEARLERLRCSLASRPQRCVLLVAHWGVLQALTGRGLEPGELASAEVRL